MEVSEKTKLLLIIEQQNDGIEVRNEMLVTARAEIETLKEDNLKLGQDNARLELLYETERSEHAKLKFIVSNQKGD